MAHHPISMLSIVIHSNMPWPSSIAIHPNMPWPSHSSQRLRTTIKHHSSWQQTSTTLVAPCPISMAALAFHPNMPWPSPSSNFIQHNNHQPSWQQTSTTLVAPRPISMASLAIQQCMPWQLTSITINARHPTIMLSIAIYPINPSRPISWSAIDITISFLFICKTHKSSICNGTRQPAYFTSSTPIASVRLGTG